MSMLDYLARLGAGIGEAEAIDDVIQTPLHEHYQVLGGDAGLLLGMGEYAPELPLHDTVALASLLLLPELETAVRYAPRRTAALLLSRRFPPPVHGALGGKAPASFEHQFLAAAAA